MKVMNDTKNMYVGVLQLFAFYNFSFETFAN